MKRSGPIKRRTWMRRKRATPRKSGRVRDRAYLLAVRELPCCVPTAVFFRKGEPSHYDHGGPVEADHAGARPLGRKCDDNETIPICRDHHRQRTDYSGWFQYFRAADMRAWCDAKIVETQARVRARLGRAA
jgi:hypothetical protein